MGKSESSGLSFFEQYGRTIFVLIVILILAIIGGQEQDSPLHPKPVTYTSFLHFIVGVIFGLFTPLTFIEWVLLHILFEVMENSIAGITFFRTSKNNPAFDLAGMWKKATGIDFWGDPKAYALGDSAVNSNFDTLFAALGFWVARADRDQTTMWEQVACACSRAAGL